MTCIIGIEHKGSIFMGGDSAGIAGWESRAVTDRKVFIREDFIIGYTSSFRMGQLLQYHLELPGVNGLETMKAMVQHIVPAIRECLKAGGYAEIDDNKESGGEFLIGYDGKLFHISEDFSVIRYTDGFAAVGVGAPYALGALRAKMDKVITDPLAAIIEALVIAESFCMGVSSPFYVLEMKDGMPDV